MLPRGFLLSVASAGIKKPGRKDMALIYSETDATVAAMFTSNRVKAAPVRLDMERAKRGRGQAIVVNSGNANACTGVGGGRDARETALLAAHGLGVAPGLVYVCSTGVIGVPMPMDRVRAGVDELLGGLGKASLDDAARAIMTTDTFPKYVVRRLKVGRREGVISAMCKGAGMIAPNMATMLCFVMTDLAVERPGLKAALKDAVEASFNRVTVDGDQSTNDTVIAMANAALGNRPIGLGTGAYRTFAGALSEACHELAKMVARDGEGATKLIEVEVKGARSEAEAKRGALAVANSLLVKTAVYGNDPNWGRIIAAIGASGIQMREERADISLSGVKLLSKGRPTGREAEAREALKGKEVAVSVALNVGRASARVLTCDLTEGYVRINAEYTT